MDLKIKYNKDKSRMQVTLKVDPARYTWEQRVFNTSYIIDELRKRDIHVLKKQCIEPTKVFNYTKPKALTGTWVFSLLQSQPEKPAAAVKEKVAEPKQAPKQAPKKSTKRV